MNYSSRERAGKSALLDAGANADAIIGPVTSKPATFAGRWVAQHFAVAPAIADTIAVLAGVGVQGTCQ